jgi:hypothetical protein
MDSWGFKDRGDATRYLSDVLRLWSGWLLGLAAVMLLQGWGLVIAGVVTIVVLVYLAKPIQARAVALVPDDTVVDGRIGLAGKRTERDNVLRALAYGKAPLEVAVDAAETGRWMLTARPVMIGVTIAAFLYVLLTTFSGST